MVSFTREWSREGIEERINYDHDQDTSTVHINRWWFRRYVLGYFYGGKCDATNNFPWNFPREETHLL
jgi:hypothetical protein